MSQTAAGSPLDRRAVVRRLVKDRGDTLFVSSLGNPTYDLAAAGDTPANFYLWGAMGSAVMVGLGLANAQPRRRVIVLAGDGELLMSLGALATVGVHKPTNLAIAVLDNEHYAETGMQLAHTGRGVDLVVIARGAGFPHAQGVRTEAELEAAMATLYQASGPCLVSIKVGTEPQPACVPPRDGPWLRSRFREALLGPAAHG